MARYWRIWKSFFKMSFMADAEYRANIIMRLLTEMVWYTMQLSVFEVLYTHTDKISGWDVKEMRVFMGTLFLVDSLYMVFFHENLEFVWSLVRKGDLDMYLTKPIKSQFMVSCRKVSVVYILNWFIISAYLTWAISNLDQPITVLQILTYVALIVCGALIYYSMRFMFSTVIVMLQDAGNIQFIWHQLFRLGTRPDPIYPPFLRYFVLFVFPLGFMASVPSRVIVHGLAWPYLTAAPGLAIFALWVSSRFWEKALKNYASASS